MAVPWIILVQVVGVAVTILGLYRSIQAYLYWTKNYHGELLTEGPYSQIRHPFYSGFVIMAIGIFLTTPALETLLLALIGTAGAILYIQTEEKMLLLEYEEEYLDYIRKTPWKIIPRVY